MKYAATYSYPTPKMLKMSALRSTMSAASRFVKAPALSLAMTLSLVLTPIANAQESVEVGYEFSRGKLTELSTMKTTLEIPAFTDERAVSDDREIFSGELADGGAVLAEKPLAEIVAEAMRAGFAASNAKLTDEGAGMRLAGSLLATEAAVVNRGGVESLQITLRTSIVLMEGSRTVWQTKLFGRGTVPASDGTAAAVGKALDRLIEELLIDDYFLAEIR